MKLNFRTSFIILINCIVNTATWAIFISIDAIPEKEDVVRVLWSEQYLIYDRSSLILDGAFDWIRDDEESIADEYVRLVQVPEGDYSELFAILTSLLPKGIRLAFF